MKIRVSAQIKRLMTVIERRKNRFMQLQHFNTFVEMTLKPLANQRLGEKFKQGRKLGTVGPIRKKIAALLKRYPSMKNEELWAKIAARPPNGWAAMDNRLGRYFEGPTASDNMSYATFIKRASDERKKLK
jgi:hypothetical protein